MDPSTEGAAILLWKVMKTASREVEEEEVKLPRRGDTPRASAPTAPTSTIQDCSSVNRPRLVSIGSSPPSAPLSPSSLDMSPLIHPSSPLAQCSSFSLNTTTIQSPNSVDQAGKTDGPTRRDGTASDVSECEERSNSGSSFVGKKAKISVKAILRKKFAWKNYPELENFLVQHRTEYLQFSSSLNYTAEQKRYNNKLTKGLLELAYRHGYVFEEFTFAMVRDRIRCYYKSYVQAARKKQRRQT